MLEHKGIFQELPQISFLSGSVTRTEMRKLEGTQSARIWEVEEVEAMWVQSAPVRRDSVDVPDISPGRRYRILSPQQPSRRVLKHDNQP
jgi:hypothetical protein